MRSGLDRVFDRMRRDEGAPPVLEAALLKEFRWRHRRGRAPLWLLRAAAVAMPLAIAWKGLWPERVPEPPAPAREIVTEFYPLTFEREWMNEEARVMRVRMPRSMMVSLGFPVQAERMEERVIADIVIGVDGTARALRFVSSK